jgi:hypothetical protein
VSRRPLVLGLGVLAAVGVATAALPSASARTPIDGTWTWTWTAADMNRAGANADARKTLLGPETCTFASGRWDGRNLSSGRRDGGRFTVSGDVVTFMVEYGRAGPRTVQLKFSIYRDRLSWSTIPGRAGWSLLTTTSWTRR